MDLMSLLFADTDRTTWRTQAACQAATAELFFPVGRTGDAVGQIEAAKNVCQTCPVRIACLRFALETNHEAGIWGGTSEEERARLRKTWLAHRRHQRQRLAV
jgi:WhiB family transcriptional regulator, redox-sensing transcriptional regulator